MTSRDVAVGEFAVHGNLDRCLARSWNGDGGNKQAQLITIGTAGKGGVGYPAGGAICRMVNEHRIQHGVRCVTKSTEGSIANLKAVRGGKLDTAVVQSDSHYQAYYGIGVFEPAGPDKKLRALLSLHAVSFTVVATARFDHALAHQLAKAVFDNFDKFKQQHPAFARLAKKQMIENGLAAPLHAGALRYYREAGLK